MDCNVSLAGVRDSDLIGEAVMERPGRILSAQEKERQALLVEFMEEHSLMACNTWQNTEHSELMCTRQAWSDGQKAQIDVIMASQDWYLQDTWIDQYTHAATDHRPVCVEMTKRILCGYKPKFTKKPRSLLNWQPGDNWTEKAKETLKEDGLGNWREWTERVRGIAQENRKDTTRRKDPLLLSLMAQFKAFSDTSPEERKFLSKRIWRRKRHLKREAIEQTIQTAAAAGRAPPGPRPSLHVRWDKLLEGKESSPEGLLSEYFKELYGVQGAAKTRAAEARALAITGWINKEDEVQKQGTSGIDATGFATALKKLKKGKNSPDGLTAEVLQNLPLEQRSRLSTEVTRRMYTLELPEEWFESTAALAPKTAGANTLAKYRPIASLSTTRKIFGYMFLASLPQLEFRSRQTAFVKGCHANMGAHMYLRIGELCREWNLECNAAQLDVRKAFDHVCHAAALRAMEEMGVGAHSRALMAKAWSLSRVRARLAAKTSEPVSLERGLPQGAPESPIILAMILECVVRRCEEKWAAKGWGFWLDGTRWVSASYADDIFLISARMRDLEATIRDITTELEAVGLGIGANKTHWSSYPAKPGQTLHVGTEQIQWEQVLIFVGMALDLSGSSWAAVRNRLNQGAVAMRKWSPIFRSKSVNGKTKLDLMITSVWASVLWGGALWTLTKAMKSAIDSWSARTVSTILGIKRGAEEAMDQWWRRFHRVGHEVLKKRGQTLSNMAERLIHRWAGHVARLPTNHWLAEVVRARAVQCWRWAQQRHTDKWTGVHPKRFKIFRWEDQLCRWHSEGCTQNPWENTGWWKDAQDRLSWRRAEK